MEQAVFGWIAQYGYIAIFGLLVLGIVGLPVPDETLLTLTGYLIYKNQFSWPLAFGSTLAGTILGITISYTLGRTFGMHLLMRYGRYVHVTPEGLHRAEDWFERIGHWALTFGYFIPGVRHLTAFIAGTSGLPWKRFAIFAYAGSVLWVTSFLSLGYFLGEQWQAVLAHIDRYLLWISIACGVLIVAYLAWRRWGSPVLRKPRGCRD